MMEKQKKLEPALALARFSISWMRTLALIWMKLLLSVIGLYLSVGSTDNDLFPHAQVLGKGKCEEAEHFNYIPTAFAPQASVRIHFGYSSLLFVALPVVPTCAGWSIVMVVNPVIVTLIKLGGR
ncbi:hypothetical protein EV702DRAFT_423862 [Suillus placidus]|uniref:Uncharacterized protein n=1 Tax=Suillus placidus TaxID=48579 RepID=A0A9P6ZTK7_9AGAM|nr:hypothetical protein EV702DRAFT_423862 [Suillus placidus]